MIMPIVVVLPAPLPPSSPQTEPRATVRVKSSTAGAALKVFVSRSSTMAGRDTSDAMRP